MSNQYKPGVFERVREYLDECDSGIKEHQACYLDDARRLVRLCRALCDCVFMQLTFHEAARKVEEEFK